MSEAKATGEFEGCVEDIRATSIELAMPPETIAKDPSSGALTKLMTFNVDRGCSYQQLSEFIYQMIQTNASTTLEPSTSVAKSGIYISKRKIAGRSLVLFAKRKVELKASDDERNDLNLIDYDPLGLMILTRPNTGTNPYEMATADLLQKYNLVASIDDINDLMQSSQSEDGIYSAPLVMERTKEEFNSFYKIWNSVYETSNKFEGELGLAPRRSKLGIISGAVLHCLPALEKALVLRRLSERSLKVIRVESSNTGKRSVGFKIPVDVEALVSIRSTMATLKEARSGIAFNQLIIDEHPGNVQPKSVSWLSQPPKTMRSFFNTISSSSNGSNNTRKTLSPQKRTNAKRKLSSDNINSKRLKGSQSKSTTITSFFKKA